MGVSGWARNYGGYVWTNHALDRLKYRGITQSDVASVLAHPERTFPGKKDGSVKFIRTINGRRIHAVATLNEEKKWVVMSVWVRGEEDRKAWYEVLIGKGVDWVMGKIVGIFGGNKKH